MKLQTLPIQKQTIDAATGEVTKTEVVNATILPAAQGTCPVCATAHLDEVPHNCESLHYQMTFFGNAGRWPTWADAMAHCSPTVKDRWTQILKQKGK